MIYWHAVNSRDDLFKYAYGTKDDNDWKLCKQTRNMVTWMIREAKRDYYIQCFEETKSNPASMLSHMRTVHSEKMKYLLSYKKPLPKWTLK